MSCPVLKNLTQQKQQQQPTCPKKLNSLLYNLCIIRCCLLLFPNKIYTHKQVSTRNKNKQKKLANELLTYKIIGYKITSNIIYHHQGGDESCILFAFCFLYKSRQIALFHAAVCMIQSRWSSDEKLALFCAQKRIEYWRHVVYTTKLYQVKLKTGFAIWKIYKWI